MFHGLLARLRESLTRSERSTRARDVLLPLLIISIALGGLAWRAWQLSRQMEHGANTLAMQYAGYAADVTARQLDSAAGSELFRVSDEWQQLERGMARPTAGTLQSWVAGHDWIVSAIYVPDADPASSIFASSIAPSKSPAHLTREFYTSGGLVRYTYDPAKLLAHVQSAVRVQPLVQARSQRHAQIAFVTNVGAGAVRTADGFGFVARLAPPLTSYGVRAFVPNAAGTEGWENARRISALVCLIAVFLTALGAYLALRGMRKEAETMKLRGALIANVSHELRTPLSMIRLGAETLKRSNKLSEKQRVDIEESILREVLHLSHLVENVLDVARMQHRQAKALAFAPVYPRELVTSVMTTYESWIRSRGFDVTVDIDDPIDEQLWDRDAVSRALLNLIDNAMKYSGDVKLLHVLVKQSEEHVVIEVRDRGIGIDAADLGRIFDPYYRAQFSDTQTRRGAGLGLTLVQQIVVSHGGRIEVDSTTGIGSTFRMLFPGGRTEAQQAVPRLAHAPQAF
ncbi:MAG TPA: HAMP domain-containing sensor histidine kinase [Thermoanaerobaculia bacterium]|nr:HAMP domain-containing sensor histidine kinase [Thermoanaerobaculia bacterium]